MKKPKNVHEVADELLDMNGPAAIVSEEWLRPVEGHGSVVYPSTYAGRGESTYNIDDTPNGKVAIVDSIPSQANRIEQLFLKPPYDELVPQIIIKAGQEQINLLKVGHRAADALVRYYKLAEELQTAFKSYKHSGNATPLAKLAPTTLIFGGWDSRDTQAKCPRMLAAEIRAYDVHELRRSSTYIPPISYKDLELLDEEYGNEVLSELGFLHAPATHQLGGVLVKAEIQRKTLLNLTTLRDVGGDEKLHRYLLGLALVAFTHPPPYNLRQGCLLVRDAEKKPVVKFVNYDGSETEAVFEPSEVLAYARNAAKEFGIGKSRTVEFDAKAANKAIKERLKEDKGKGGRKRAAVWLHQKSKLS